ncbi:MAG: hypothetical protein GC190_14345 [Alphaproteobacteria bacterium]|nr:hypothetical protein [Alphaproteobacteria bacterium]
MTRYLRLLLGIPLALTFAMAAINVLVDPFDIYRIAAIKGFNEPKPERGSDGARVAIGFDLVRGKYAVLFLGTSRVQNGIPDQIDGLPSPIENAGMPSADVIEIARATALASRHKSLRCVFIGLDYEMADSSAKTKGTYWLSPLSGASPAMSRLRTALSITTFHRSLDTLSVDAFGMASGKRVFGIKGQRARFVAITRDYFAKSRSFVYDPQRLRLIGIVVERLTRAGIQVVGFIPPIHAWNEEAFIRAGNADNAKRFRRDLVQIFDHASTRTPRAPCVAGGGAVLWDFGGFQPLSEVPIPASSATALQPYYRETSHFHTSVGTALVRRMLGLDYAIPFKAQDFGVRLTATKLDADLSAIDRRRSEWLARSADATQLAAMISKWRKTDADKRSTTEKYSLTTADLSEFEEP